MTFCMEKIWHLEKQQSQKVTWQESQRCCFWELDMGLAMFKYWVTVSEKSEAPDW